MEGVLGSVRGPGQTLCRGSGQHGGYASLLVAVRDIIDFFRRNPQALALLVICLVLGIGAFIAVLIGVASSGSRSGPGYPSGTVLLFQGLNAGPSR